MWTVLKFLLIIILVYGIPPSNTPKLLNPKTIITLPPPSSIYRALPLALKLDPSTPHITIKLFLPDKHTKWSEMISRLYTKAEMLIATIAATMMCMSCAVATWADTCPNQASISGGVELVISVKFYRTRGQVVNSSDFLRVGLSFYCIGHLSC